MLAYPDARQKVIEVTGGLRHKPGRETVEISQAFGRILAEPVFADRDYPPFDRATRDGFAVRAADDEARLAHGWEHCVAIARLKEPGAIAGILERCNGVRILVGVRYPGGKQ